MKYIPLLFCLLFALAGCKKEEVIILGCTDPTSTSYNPSATHDNGDCEYEGQLTFWYNSFGTDATVHVAGQTGVITQHYSGIDPDCGASGCANFTLPTGSYTFTASSTFSTWNGNVTVYKNDCTRMLLQ